MATSEKRVNFQPKRIMGMESFKDNMFDFLRNDIHNVINKVYRTSGAFTPIGMGSTVADTFTLNEGGGAFTDIIHAMDGDGYFLNLDKYEDDVTQVAFENAVGNSYYVALRFAEVPSGLFVNPRDGQPMFDTYEERIGWEGQPVPYNNGDGTMTFVVTSVTQAGVSNAGRKVIVYKIVPGIDAQTEAVAIEECTVYWDAGLNKIDTVGNFGQGSNVSTSGSDYRVVLLGPRVARNVDLRTADPWMFVGIITGNGPSAIPTVFDTDDQKTIDIPLSDLADIVRYEGASGADRLKIDVNVYGSGGDEDEDQIRVTNVEDYPGTPIRFKVDGHGNVEIQGDLTVQGDTFQKDITQVDTHNAIFDNLQSGNQETDYQQLYGNVTINAGTPAIPSAYAKFFPNGKGGSSPLVALVSPVVSTADIGLAIGDKTAIDADFVPGTPNTHDIGAASNKFANLYVQNIYADATSIGGSLLPDTDNSYDIGSGSLRWHDLHLADDIYISGNNPAIRWLEEDSGGTNEKRWRTTLQGASYEVQLWNDAEDTVDTAFRINRTGSGYNVTYAALRGPISLNTMGAPVEFDIECAGDLGPSSTASRTLGSSTRKWKEIHVSNALGDGFSSIMPLTDGNLYLGNASQRWGAFFLSDDAGDGMWTNLVPRADSTLNLGSATYRWAEVHSDKLILNTAPGLGVGTSLNPTVTNTYALGNMLYSWSSLWVNQANVTQLSLATTAGNGVTTDIVPSISGAFDLGSTSYKWTYLYINQDIYCDNDIYCDLIAADRISTTSGTGSVTVQNDLIASSTLIDLGSSADRFGNLWLNGAITSNSYVKCAGYIASEAAANVWLNLKDTAGTSGYQSFRIRSDDDVVYFQAMNDAHSTDSNWLTFTRASAAVAGPIRVGDSGAATEIDFTPYALNKCRLGNTGYWWKELYVQTAVMEAFAIRNETLTGTYPHIIITKDDASYTGWENQRIEFSSTGQEMYWYFYDGSFSSSWYWLKIRRGAAGDYHPDEVTIDAWTKFYVSCDMGVSGTLFISGDGGSGLSSQIGLTDVFSETGGTTGAYSGSIKIYVGTNTRYLYFWDAP